MAACAVVAGEGRDPPHLLTSSPSPFHSSAPGVCHRLVQKFKEQGLPSRLCRPCGRGAGGPGKKTLGQCPWFPGKAPRVVLCW